MRRLDRLDVAYVQQLAEMLVERVPGTSIDAGHFVKLCLNELLQNVFEHSESRFGCFVLARWYAAERNVKIIVVDGGIGIPAALRRELVDNLQRAPEFEIVREAVTREGLTSRKTGRLGGLGLKHIHGLVTARGGRLIVLTHQTRVVFKKDHFGHRKNRVFFAGTAIELDFRPYDQQSGSAAVPDEVF